MNVNVTIDNVERKNDTMKQKFYDYVDKYLMAMQIDVMEYEDLSDATLAEFAFRAACTCRNYFDIAWEHEEALNEGTIERVAPDLNDEQLEESVAVLLDEINEKEIEEWENTKTLKEFVKLLFNVEDIDEYVRELRKSDESSLEFDELRARNEAERKAEEEEKRRKNTINTIDDLLEQIVFDD